MLTKIKNRLVFLLFFAGLMAANAQSVPGIKLDYLESGRPDLSYQLGNSFFLVHYDDASLESYAENALAYAIYAYNKICTERGWIIPISDNGRGGDNRYDIYIHDIPGALGVTTGEILPGVFSENCPSYIEISPELLDYELKIVVAHEFTHACQLSYSYKDTDNISGFWFYENTAVWMADEIYNYEYNYYQRYFEIGHDLLNYPEYSINYNPPLCFFAYGGFIWVKFLSEWTNSNLIIRQIWTRLGENPGENILEDTDFILDRQYDKSLNEALRTYAEWRYFTGDRDDGNHFEHAGYYPTAKVHQIHETYPAYTQGFAVMGPGGTAFIKFVGASDVINVSMNGDDNHRWEGSIIESREVGGNYSVINRKFTFNEYWEGSINGIFRETNEFIFSPVCISEKKTLTTDFYSAVLPEMKAVKFENKYGISNIGGQLLLDGTINVNSGDFVILANNSSHIVKTKLERKLWESNLLKHCLWNTNQSNFLLSKSFLVTQYSYDQTSVYNKIENTTIKNSIEGLSFNNNVLVQFNDPWYVKDQYGNQSGMGDFLSVSSPYVPTGAYNQATGGVFLNQSGPGSNWQPPYYSVQAISPQDISLSQTGKTHRFYFQNWTGTNVNFQNANNLTTGVVFTNDNAVVNANMKGTQLSNQGNTYENNSQRKFVRNGYGELLSVHESMGKIWVEKSSNNGTGWELLNQGNPVGSQFAEVSRYPSIDYIALISDGLESIQNIPIIVYEDRISSPPNIYLQIKVSWLSTGNQFAEEVVAENYSEDMPSNPVIATLKNNRFIVLWWGVDENNQEGLFYRLGNITPTLTCNWLSDVMYIDGTGLNSQNQTISANKENSSTATIHLAWQDYVSSTPDILYTTLSVDANDYVSEGAIVNISANSGYTHDYSPSIVAFGDGARLCWIGRRTSMGIAKGEIPEEGIGEVIEHRVVFKDPGYYRYWTFIKNTGGTVHSPNINKTDNNSAYVFGWSENDGAERVFANNSLSSIFTMIGTTGKYLQVSNGANTSNMFVNTFNNSAAPYYFSTTVSINTFYSLQKTNAAGISRGREGIVGKDSVQFYFGFGDILVDNEPVEFKELSDSLIINNNTGLNATLETEPFALTDNSDFEYGVQFGIAGPAPASVILNGEKYVKFKIELVDAGSNEVIGVFDDVTFDEQNLEQYDNLSYQVNTAGIGNRNVKLRLQVSDNIDATYAVSDNLAETSMFGKKGMKTISYLGDLTVTDYALSQNYPNPFNPVTTINYQIPKDGFVSLKVYDILGKEIATLVNSDKAQGKYTVEFDGSRFASGMYIYKLQSGDFVETRKMMMLK